jgi:hypothetical protein
VVAPRLIGGQFEVAIGPAHRVQTSLERLSNAIDTFFRGSCLSRRFYTQQTTCSPQFVVPEPNAFPYKRLTFILPFKRCWTAVRNCNAASHNMHWTCSCGVDIVTELAKGHQVARVRKLSMKKKMSEFFFWWHKPDTCMTISFRDMYFFILDTFCPDTQYYGSILS